LGGDKFSNGAITAAFDYLFNQSVHAALERAITPGGIGDSRNLLQRFLSELRYDTGAQKEINDAAAEVARESAVTVVHDVAIGTTAAQFGFAWNPPLALAFGRVSSALALTETILTRDPAPLVGDFATELTARALERMGASTTAAVRFGIAAGVGVLSVYENAQKSH